MKNFTLNPLVLAVALATLSTGASAQAPEEATEEVIVSGFRESLANALNLKRENTSSVDSIVAEDIADFPDNNLAESLQRVPGVVISKAGGEGSQISIRGLSPEFSRVRINGMETIATGVSSSGANRGRAFDFNIFASELFSRIDVHKTQQSEIEEGSLGATVDLTTGHPLDYENLTLVTSLQGGYNDQSKATDPRFTGLVSMKNDEGTLGGLVSVAYSERNVTQEGHNSGRWEANTPIDKTKTLSSQNNHWKVVTPAKTAASVCSATLTENCWMDAAYTKYAPTAQSVLLDNAVHPRFSRQMDREIGLERLGATASFQWKPTDATSVTLDAMLAKIDSTTAEKVLTPISLSRTTNTGRAETTVNSYTLDPASGAMIAANLSGVDVRAESFQQDWSTNFTQYTLKLEHEFADNLRMSALLGTSKSKMEVAHESTAILERFNAGLTYDYSASMKNPTLAYDFDTTNPANWKISELRDVPADTTNTNDTAQLNFAYDINDIFTAKVGLSQKEFSFDNNQYTRSRAVLGQSAGVATLATAPTGCTLTLANYNVTADLGSVFNPSNGQNSFFLPNLAGVFDHTGYLDNDTCFPQTRNVGGDRSVTETDTGLYAQLDFKTELFAMPLRGDIGVRQAQTDQSSTGVLSRTITTTVAPITTSTVYEDLTVERSYSDTLPSINLVLEPIDSVAVRAAWSKVMTRPGLGSLTPGFSVDNFNRKLTFGNPNLEPFRADALDLSVDWYFAEEAVVSLAWFKKDIESFTFSSTANIKWTEIINPNDGQLMPDSLLANPATNADTFAVTNITNGTGGTLDGFELQYQQRLTFLPGPAWLENFGIKANVTLIDSEMNYGVDSAGKSIIAPIRGQSDVSWNWTLWYENDSGFQGRVSTTYRDPYMNEPTSTTKLAGYDTTAEQTAVDASFSYQVNKNIKVSLDLLNLTNESETLLLSDYNLVETDVTSGRQYYLGVQYSF